MPKLRAHVVDSPARLKEFGSRWDDLWRRSDQTSPVLRWDLLENWLNCFAPGQALRAVLVEQDGSLVAAIPLVERRWGGILGVGTLPCNEWSLAGELMLDSCCDCASVLDCLAAELGQLDWPLLRLAFARLESPAWRKLRPALEAAGFSLECRPSYEVTFIETPDDWETFRRTWSKNHRHRLGGRLRRLREQGEVRLNRIVPESADEALPLLDVALRIEDSGWKGRAGTSVLRTPAIADYLHRLAMLLVPHGELEFAFLELDRRPIAFEILLHAKRVLHSYKVGYDEQFEWFDPGHLLMHELLHETCVSRRAAGYDCLGPDTIGVKRWRGSTYQVGGLVAAPPRWLGQALLFTYRHCRRKERPAEILRGTPADEQVDASSKLPAVRQAVDVTHD